MDKMVEILLGSEKNIDSVNTDSYSKVELVRNTSELNEFTVNDVVNSTVVFDAERQENQVYRIYGRIEWMSLLNGLTNSPRILENFFFPQYDDGSKNIINSFDFYLVAPSSGETYNPITGTNKLRRNFEVIATPNEFEIYDAGFTNNVYGEQVYSFSFNIDFDVSEYYDNLGFPLTELFLYAQYKKQSNNYEEISRTFFDSTGIKIKTGFTTKDFNIGDILENYQGNNIQDVIEYSAEKYYQAQVDPQIFYIRTNYIEDSITKWLEWSYNPLIPFRLRYLDGVVSTAKLDEIIRRTTTLRIFPTSNPTHVLLVGKSKKQSLSTSLATLTNWDASNTSYYTWLPTTGKIVFTVAGTYSISFKTQIYLSNGTDKYIAQIYLNKYNGSNSIITNTTRKINTTNTVEGINVVESFAVGDELSVKIQLIPNPNKRELFIIPDYALILTDEGRYVWRDIVPQGYSDPITNLGVFYPFFNKRRYLFDTIVFAVPPNLSTETYNKHQNTLDVFDEIEYYQYASTLDTTPTSNDELDNIGKPCQ